VRLTFGIGSRLWVWETALTKAMIKRPDGDEVTVSEELEHVRLSSDAAGLGGFAGFGFRSDGSEGE
jgi:hypothetical protein